MADKDHHARLVIHDLALMPEAERTRLVAWLHTKAYEIRDCKPQDYSSRYTARLMKRGA